MGNEMEKRYFGLYSGRIGVPEGNLGHLLVPIPAQIRTLEVSLEYNGVLIPGPTGQRVGKVCLSF